MKQKYILLCIVAFIGMIFTACDDAELGTKDNSLYIADAASAKSTTVAMELSGADVNITVRLAHAIDHDVQVSIGTDANLLAKYNETNSTEYLLVPAEHSSFSANTKITILAGDVSAIYKVHINAFDTEGKRYALPVVLGDVTEGNVSKSAAQSKFIYLISKPLIVSVPVMTGYNNESVRLNPTTQWNLLLPQWSIECWARMSAYSKNNQAIFDNGDALTEVYIRFGDANAPYNYLQTKTLGGQVQTERDLIGGVWYHWAFVYDGTNFTVYRNGEFNTQFAPPAPQGEGGTVRFNCLYMIGSGATYFPDQCGMSQVRFWKTALTQTQIKNNMYYSVDPTNPNLIAYLPMDEGSGNIFHDITGNGHDAIAGSHILQRWENDVRFDK